MNTSAKTKLAEFTVDANWAGDMMSGGGQLNAPDLNSPISVPTKLGGPGNATNPEELLAAASSSCALITAVAILQFHGVPAMPVSCRTTTEFEQTPNGPKAVSVTHNIELDSVPDQIGLEKLAQMVEGGCMVSQAMRGNVETKAQVKIRETV
ncbi:OsmC-like protein [Pseudovibrio axinellae]|uniref:OsmC-like protein n=1 Tax=Pseudovibrio axinellae TaxID=989403 RepID=A0A161XCL7_9HYPH|nr:OsmC family protein [Pseudovibrio axinellae]KZL09103.1 OsmC-like protein [Pseudovibrio axinellae]SER75426.1 peroxiredoxin, SACOL1771 subfamily [Pseudovibrio axinellae]